MSDDERLLAELGYKQELERSWGGFTNFAISFSIISVLAGCFTVFYVGWNNGGPIVVSIGWLRICLPAILITEQKLQLNGQPRAGEMPSRSRKRRSPST